MLGMIPRILSLICAVCLVQYMLTKRSTYYVDNLHSRETATGRVDVAHLFIRTSKLEVLLCCQE